MARRLPLLRLPGELRENTSAAGATIAPMGTEVDDAGIEERMDAIRLKQILGHPLTERELMCLQMEQNGFGCASCSGATPAPELP